MENVGSLNKKLRDLVKEEQEEVDIAIKLETVTFEEYKLKARKIINNLLLLEEKNYKVTISIFLLKIGKYELLKKNADEDEYDYKLEEINKLKIEQKNIRVQINEMIQELIYSNI
jgi:hypothetical protein